MLHAMRDEVLRVKADVALGFDGDGDRCGVVNNEGEEIFADKVGVMLARDISSQHPGATFVADVKSTGLFMTDPVLPPTAPGPILENRPFLHEAPGQRDRRNGGDREIRPLLLQPAARPRLRRWPGVRARGMRHARPQSRKEHGRPQNALPKTWSSPTMSPHCADEIKYRVVNDVVKHSRRRRRRARRWRGSRFAIWSPSTACG